MMQTRVELPSGINQMQLTEKELNDVLTVGARGVSNYLKKFYREKNANEPNKLNPSRRTNFWNKVGNTVNNPKTEGRGRVVVAISSPILPHKVKGGTISAKRVQYLTIPVHPEAYDRNARRFDDLFVIKSKKGNLLLVKPDKPSGNPPQRKFNAKKEAKRKLPNTTRPRRENKPLGLNVPERETPTMQEESGFTPYYLLKKSVTQKPWPNSIPTEQEVTDVFVDEATFYADELIERKSA
jgi:hypothetical protein